MWVWGSRWDIESVHGEGHIWRPTWACLDLPTVDVLDVTGNSAGFRCLHAVGILNVSRQLASAMRPLAAAITATTCFTFLILCRRLAWSTNTRSTNSNRLVAPPVKRSTVGSRAFAVAAPHIWNTLPTDVVAANSLSTFRPLLKRFYSSSHILTSSCTTSSTLKIY